jgi:formylglycine-generating enzyme required for sulfatase activity
MAESILENNKLKQLISRLNGHLNLTGEDIADIIWLGLKQQEYSAKIPEQETITNGVEDPSKEENRKEDDKPPNEPNKIKPPKPDESKVSISPSSPPNNFDDKIKGKTLPIRHTDPRSLREPLEFVKALRPLMRRVDSGRQTILDEIETVKLIAEQSTGEQRICIPVLKSEPEPWLDLALVIDDNSSMIIWRKLIEELKEILEHYGIFREVRTWGLTKDKDKIIIKAKVGKQQTKNVQIKNLQELIDPTGRCLILIVSDCVAPMWFDGTILSALQHWTKHQPLAILSMLPNTLWLRSGLRVGAAVRLVNRNGGSISEVANINLRIHELLIWKDFDLENRSKIPVLTLEPEVASNWAGFLVGNYNKINGGFIFPHNSDFIRPPQLPQTQISNLNAKDRIERFRRISSPLGRKLAGLLMAAPLISLPVIRLVQEILLRESRPVHTAEVLLGGILKPLTEITTDINPDGVIFDEVVPGIRNILLEDAPFSDSRFIFDTISDYIEKQIGKSLKECVALLNQPSSEDDGEKGNLAKAYAAISLKVLKGLGGEYAEFAERVKQVEDPPEAFFEQFAGNYIWAVKENGTWQEQLEGLLITRYLLISPQGEVQFGSQLDVVTIQNLSVKGQTLSWTFDDNESAASITFKINSEDNYFWEQHQTGKLFEGWLEYPNQDRKYFRGRFEVVVLPPLRQFKVKTIILIDDSINPQTFDFQVAVIKANQSSQSNGNNILEQINEAVFNKTEKYLTDIEKQLLNGALENLTYKQIYNQIRESANYPESEQQLSNSIAKPLWKVLTEIIGEKVTKSNVKSLINKWSASSHLTIDHHSAQATGFIQDLANDTQLEMMLIPGDTFIMGSPPEELEHRDRESPQHSVTVQPFFMGKYQVTQAQWRFVAQLPQVNKELDPEPSNFKGDGSTSLTNNRPVEQVSWKDAVEFCDRLSQYTGRTYRLPSEAEWEYACRAGTKTPFHFGETITTDLANYDGESTYGDGVEGVNRGETTEVGSFGVANNFGLYDMHGNLDEWCLDDWHDNYKDAPTDGSAWFSSDDKLSDKSGRAVLRGGSWFNLPQYCRSAYRFSINRDNHYLSFGFRVVCVVGRTLR